MLQLLTFEQGMGVNRFILVWRDMTLFTMTSLKVDLVYHLSVLVKRVMVLAVGEGDL